MCNKMAHFANFFTYLHGSGEKSTSVPNGVLEFVHVCFVFGCLRCLFTGNRERLVCQEAENDGGGKWCNGVVAS